MRFPKFAGTFYESSETLLQKQIDDCFSGKRGPGEVPGKRKGALVGVIAPHAGYPYSGMCAAWSYKVIAESEIPDLYIIIGPNHHGAGSGISVETFQMPFGLVRTDLDFANKLAAKGTLKVNEKIHQEEHSIEVQLPFLQFTLGRETEKLKVLQILVGNDIDLKKAALDLKETLMDTGKKAVFILSSDFTHYGMDYHYVPFVEKIQESIYELDQEVIAPILKGDVNAWTLMLSEKDLTVCGVNAIELFLRTVKFHKADLEAYYTSGDLVGKYRNSVSYASIIFR
jgi:AmmeMemoRadiSam system protein B